MSLTIVVGMFLPFCFILKRQSDSVEPTDYSSSDLRSGRGLMISKLHRKNRTLGPFPQPKTSAIYSIVFDYRMTLQSSLFKEVSTSLTQMVVDLELLHLK